MPLHVPSVVELEGEYTIWTHVWTRDYGAGAHIGAVLVDNYGTCYVKNNTTGRTKLRTYEGAETTRSNYEYFMPRFTDDEACSMMRKYVLAENRTVDQQMDIWRYGVLIASINLTTDNPDNNRMTFCSKSPNGKFIAFVLISKASGYEQYLMLYEGS